MPLTSSGARTLDDILANGVRGEPEVDGMATLEGAAIQVLVWNYHDNLVTVPATPVHLAITVPAGFGPSARVSHLRVDESHGDAYTVWVSQGMPASPSAAEVAALRQAIDPALLVPDRTVAVGADGVVGVDFELPRFGVSLVTLQPAAGASASSGSEGPAVGRGAGVLKAPERLAEVVDVRESPFARDLLQRRPRREEHARRFLHPHLGYEARGREAGARAKVVAEVTAGHPPLVCDCVDARRTAGRRQRASAQPFEQPLPVTPGIAQLVRQPFVRQHELEQRELHLEAVAKVLLERAAHEAHRARHEQARRRYPDDRPRERDLLGDTATR